MIARGTDSAKVIQVIVTTALKGEGTEKDPVRIVTQYRDFDGNLLAENGGTENENQSILRAYHMNRENPPDYPICIHKSEKPTITSMESARKDMECFFDRWLKKKNSGFDVEGPAYSGAYPTSDDE